MDQLLFGRSPQQYRFSGTKPCKPASLKQQRQRTEKFMKKQRRRILPTANINVTPFIDILLVLLVIFMTITPVTSKGLDTTIPQPPPPNSHPQQEAQNPIVLSMDRSGAIRINQQEIPASRLIARLQEIFKSRNDRTVFVQADDALLFSDVAQLIDSANGAGVRVGLMTERISTK